MKQTPQEQIKELTDKLVTNLLHITEYPDGWLPHSVWIEEEDEDGDPTYRHYMLEKIRTDGTCDLHDPETGKLLHDDYLLSAINIDWLITVWHRYRELCIEQGLWREQAIHLLEQETDASLPDIIEFVGDHWQNLSSDEENIEAFRRWIAPAASQVLPKELFAFVWPFELMPRNATDEQILTAYENGPSRSLREGDDVWDEDDETLYEVRKLTPDELAAEINDSDCAFGQYYVRFIEV